MDMSKAEQAFKLLRRDILDARLPPDASLPVSSLKKRYGLGWTPIREALSRLETERLVVFSPNKGYRVAGVSTEELSDLQETRKAVETSLLINSISVGDLEWEKRLVAAHHEFKQSKPLHVMMPEADLALWEKRHRAFHRALLSGAVSIWLSRICEQINDHLDRHHRAMVLASALAGTPSLTNARQTEILSRVSNLEHHTRLMEAALERDNVVAVELLYEHISFTLEAYEEITAATSE